VKSKYDEFYLNEIIEKISILMKFKYDIKGLGLRIINNL